MNRICPQNHQACESAAAETITHIHGEPAPPPTKPETEPTPGDACPSKQRGVSTQRAICAWAPGCALERFPAFYADNSSTFLDAWRRTERRKHALNCHENRKQVIKETCSLPVACSCLWNSGFLRRLRGKNLKLRSAPTRRCVNTAR